MDSDSEKEVLVASFLQQKIIQDLVPPIPQPDIGKRRDKETDSEDDQPLTDVIPSTEKAEKTPEIARRSLQTNRAGSSSS